MCRVASGVGAGASSGLDLEAVAPQQRKALERRQKQRLRKRYFRALEAGREPPEAALSLGEEAMHQMAQAREQQESHATGTAARQMPHFQTVVAVVTRSRQIPYMSPSPAPATPPIQVVEMEQCWFLQQVSLAPTPMLCAVQDVRPVSESTAMPMVMVETVPAVSKGGQSTCVARSFPEQPNDVPNETPVAEVAQRMEKASSPYEGDYNVEREGISKRLVLPYIVKNTFIEVEDPEVDGMDQWGEGHARRQSRAQTMPARSCH